MDADKLKEKLESILERIYWLEKRIEELEYDLGKITNTSKENFLDK